MPPSTSDKSPSEPESQDADVQWLQTLSEPELDLLISLKELAVTQAAQFDLSQRFHLRTLRALGTVLLEHFKDQQNQNSGGINRLALLKDPDEHAPSHRPEVPESNQVQSMSNGVGKKRNQLQDGPGEESTSRSKKKRRRDKR